MKKIHKNTQRKKGDKYFTYSFFFLFFLILIATPAFPAQAERTIVKKGAVSSNAEKQNYTTWARPVKSYLYSSENQTLTRVEAIENQILYETYDSHFKLIKKCAIPKELDLFGGFYAGETANYLVFGQKNPKESNQKEIIRVVKYTKTWKRLGSCGLSDCNTTIPFEAGSLRFAESGNMLYIRTCHKMYTSSDGLNHQANLTFSVDTSAMKITDSFSDVSNLSDGYVSHSFNQWIQVDGQDLLAVDHGDAYPRSLVLIKYSQPAGSPTFLNSSDVSLNSCSSLHLLDFPGEIGDNTTHASVGGFEVSSSAYLVAGNYANTATRENRNIFLSVTPKEAFLDGSSTTPTLIYLTDISANAKQSTTTPQLVKINDNRFLVLWEEILRKTNGYQYRTCYLLVDGNGKACSKLQRFSGKLSECQPIVAGQQVIWYYTQNSAPIFCTIPADGTEAEDHPLPGDEFTLQGITYQVTKREGTTKTAAVKSVAATKKSTLTIPDSITIMGETYLVTELKNYALGNCKKTKKVVLGKNLIKLENTLFSYPNQIKTIVIKSTKLKTVHRYAFTELSSQAVIQVPKSKVTAYRKLLKGRIASSQVRAIPNK